MTDQQLRNQNTQALHRAAVERVRQEWALHPEKREAFLEAARQKHQQTLDLGVRLGWWSGYDERGPLAPPRIFKLSELQPHENTRAHLAEKVGAFKSVSDARKNGLNIPLVAGDEFWLKKKTIHIKVEA